MSNHSKASLVRNLFQQDEDGLWYNSGNDTDSEDFIVVENVDIVKSGNCFSDSSHDGSSAQLSSSSPPLGQQPQQQQGYDEVGNDYDYANEQNEDVEEEDDELERRPSYLPSMFHSGFGESIEV